MEKTYKVTGMDCASCAASVERGVKRLAGVQNARVDFATEKMYLDGEVALETLRERVEKLGYGLAEEGAAQAHGHEHDHEQGHSHSHEAGPKVSPNRGAVLGFWDYLRGRRETRLALFGGGLALLTLIGALIGLPSTLTDVLFIVAMALTAYPIARSGINNLVINHEFNINLLMTIAAVGAVLIGETLEAATVIFVFAIGESLEGYTADRARDSLRSLMSLAPATAIRLDRTTQTTVPVEALRVDDTILVMPGERISMDGVVASGESGVNHAPITGESVPVHKGVGADVFAGTINGEGALQIRVTRLAADNTLSRIIKLVEEAQGVRAPSQRMIDRFANIYTPAVTVIAVLVAIVPPLLFSAPFFDTPETHGWLYRALSLLVIACPCALVISTPVTVISAITGAARRGVLIKGGAFLEALGSVKAFAFDKTGTLTHGQPEAMAPRSID